MIYLQPFDAITVRERPALFLHYMTMNRSLARVRFTDTEQRRTVLSSEIEPSAAAVQRLVAEAFQEEGL